MKKVSQKVTCGNCRATLDEPSNLVPSLREPCPECGSRSRCFEVLLESELLVRGKLGAKAWRGGERRKPFLETIKGNDLFIKLGKWVKLERIIDRENDRYKEIVTDPETGKIIHQCEEPLSQHEGHGSAKEKK